YEFKHSLYRQAVYRGLSDVVRSRLHRIIGKHLSQLCTRSQPELASELAMHFELGRDYQRAIDFLILTSENITRRFASRDSIQVLQQALSLATKTAAAIRTHLEIKVLDRIGDAYYALGDMRASADALEHAASRAAVAGLKSEEVNVLNAMSRSLVLIDGDLGIAASRRSLKDCQEVNDPLLLARTQLLAATLRLGYDAWRKEEAEICARAREAIAKLTGPHSPTYHEMWNAHIQPLQGQNQEAVESADEGICKYYEVWDTDRQTL